MFGLNIEDLTAGERLFLQRRRLGEDQKTAAKKHGVGFIHYGQSERINRFFPKHIEPITEVKDYEWCVIVRRRKKLKQRELAEELKVCKLWLLKMETGQIQATRLVQYWEESFAVAREMYLQAGVQVYESPL